MSRADGPGADGSGAVRAGVDGSGAVRAGVLADLAVLVPVLVVYEVLHGTGTLHGDAGTVVVAVLAALIAPLVGGVVAGRASTPSPLRSAAAATAMPIAVFVVVRIIDSAVRGTSVTVAGEVAVVMISVSVGMVGGVIGSTHHHRADSAP